MKKIKQETTYTYELTSADQVYLIGILSLIQKYQTIGNVEIVKDDLDRISKMMRELSL